MKRAAAAIALAAIAWQLPAATAGAQERLTREALAGADYVRGRLAFQQRCSACHTLAEGALHLAGPNLWEVIGRTAGSREKFSYSETLKKAGFAWTRTGWTTGSPIPTSIFPATPCSFPNRCPAATAWPYPASPNSSGNRQCTAGRCFTAEYFPAGPRTGEARKELTAPKTWDGRRAIRLALG